MSRVVLGVTGGIAAYKAAELVRLLIHDGHEVRCMMTEEAQRFLTPLTLEILSGNAVQTDLFAENTEWPVAHIGLAQWAECICIVPATANVIGKIANGIADDFVTTCVMATKAPVLFAPAMNDGMYQNPILQENLNKLRRYGYQLVEPIYGALACGTEGVGKLETPERIAESIKQCLQPIPQDLAGLRILVSAGPTRENIDPVRFITNHSSGKMGYAIAACAKARGATVTLVSGPTELLPPMGVDMVNVISAQEMAEAVWSRSDAQDAIVMAAAVADYRPKEQAMQKVKKQDGDWQLQLERNPDILATLGANRKQQILVGFAAETEHCEEHALHKLEQKNLDMIVANDLTRADSGFGTDTNCVTIYHRNGAKESLPTLKKQQVANHILDNILKRVKEQKNHA